MTDAKNNQSTIDHWLTQAALPDSLQVAGSKKLSDWLSQFEVAQQAAIIDWCQQTALGEENSQQCVRAIIGSDYIAEQTARYPAILFETIFTTIAHQVLSPEVLKQRVLSACEPCESIEGIDTQLRKVRRLLMVSIVWQDLNRTVGFAHTAANVTALAEVCLQCALDFHYRLLSVKYGVPIGRDSKKPQPMMVIGMGKLGGGELNVSSDIDLLLAFPELGNTEGGPKSIDNQRFFDRLGQGIIGTLNTINEQGFVFRVDMRLRPYGKSGSLTSHFDALEHYYQTQGREWERFAMIKSRVVASTVLVLPLDDEKAQGNTSKRQKRCKKSIKKLYRILQAFTYRQYIDFSVIESLRQLKLLINQEVRRRDLRGDIKLGAGGIREIEFIVQAFQLIRAGKQPQLQERGLLAALHELVVSRDISEDDGTMLREAYLFLRNLEHLLQGFRDEQTQELPTEKNDLSRLGWSMGFEDSESFLHALESHQRQVNEAFVDMIADPDAEESDMSQWQGLWQASEHVDDTAREQSHDQPQADTLKSLHDFRHHRVIASLGKSATEQLNRLLPKILSVSETPEQLQQLLTWLTSIAQRSVYLTLLVENPSILESLVTLFAASPWISEQLTHSPSLLDELLNDPHLTELPSKELLANQLRQQLMRIDEDNLEAQMETLRYFKLSHSLKAAASEVSGQRNLMKTSDYLTYLAEVILSETLSLAWASLIPRYGEPSGDFIMVGYGKLGGIEMSYSSDLDLVFIYRGDAQQSTTGNTSIDTHTFFTRLGQKVIHLLTTRMSSGQLYEVDMRLRPSGSSGLLVSTLAAFERYQQQDAWVWEHQAMVRARVVAGNAPLATVFAQLRSTVLSKSRNLDELKQDVIDMRAKMRGHLGQSENSTLFDLKQDAGGIVDIEFMVQYAVLAWSHQAPTIAGFTDNIRILESLQAAQLISAKRAQFLIDTYQTYRMATHKLALQQQPATVNDDLFRAERQHVCAIWQELFSQ